MFCFVQKRPSSFCIVSQINPILEWKPVGRRIRGRPRKRWIENVEEDIQMNGIRGWRKLSKERTEWKKITEKAKTHRGL